MNNNSKQWQGPYLNSIHYYHAPYWKRASNDWRFWVGVALMFAAINIYVMSDDLALRYRLQPLTALSGSAGK